MVNTELHPWRYVAALPWALISAGVVALWIPLKMLRVAHGDTSTALAVLAASDKATVVGGLLVLLLPSAVVLLWAGLWMVAASAFGRIWAAAAGQLHVTEEAAHRALLRVLVSGIAWSGLAWLAAAVVPLSELVAVALMMFVVSAVSYLSQRRTPSDSELPGWLTRSPLRIAVAATVVVILATLLILTTLAGRVLDDRMWLAPHVLETRSETFSAYVLNHADGRRTLLRDSDRRLVTVADAEVMADEICQLDKVGDERALLDVLGSRPRSGVATCPN